MASPGFFETMLFSYGQGEYHSGGHWYAGTIMLSQHKLYLKNDRGDIARTFIPLEKVYKIRSFWNWMRVSVRPSTFTQFEAVIKGKPGQIRSLRRDLVDSRQLKPRKFGLEWVDAEM